MKLKPFLHILIVLTATKWVSCLKLNQVDNLPGFNGTFPSRHFAGYINVNLENNRTLYYYFVESENDPSKDPVVLWLNGGPGCSSFDGWIYEHGPFVFSPGKSDYDMPTLKENPFSWSKVANMLYVDSPAGVGLSYTKDFVCSDTKTGKDLHIFLQKWFTLYSKFSSNDFFIAGESYAGIYVPVVAREVAKGIEAKVEPVINFKGYYIGNGCTDNKYDGDAFVPFIAGHGLISFDQKDNVEKECKGSYWNATGKCELELEKIYEEVDQLNIYDILEPCFHNPSSNERSVSQKLPESFKMLGNSNPREFPVRRRMMGRAWPLAQTKREGKVTLWGENEDDDIVPCTDDRVATVWLNNEEVRKALHALPVSNIGPWELCTLKIEYYADAGSMIPIHRFLIESGYRALIYSGDHDLCVPYTGSEKWTRDLGYGIVDGWRPWFVDGQVAGYTQKYDRNFTFATILGAGHTVPEYKPKESLHFHTRFLQNEPL